MCVYSELVFIYSMHLWCDDEIINDFHSLGGTLPPQVEAIADESELPPCIEKEGTFYKCTLCGAICNALHQVAMVSVLVVQVIYRLQLNPMIILMLNFNENGRHF